MYGYLVVGFNVALASWIKCYFNRKLIGPEG